MNKEFLKIGHRGACGYAPENTLLSFKKALELNVDMIELDVRICKTGEIVSIHDDTVDRTTDGKGRVKTMSLSELKKLDAGRGEKIPLLNEILDLVNRRARVNIELKGPDTAVPVVELIEEYIKKRCWLPDDFLLSSFDRRELIECRKLNPAIRIGVNIDSVPPGYSEFAEKMGAWSIHPSSECVNSKIVDDAHGRGMKVFVWTANTREEIGRLKQLNVDGIFSNYPDLI